MTAAAANSAVDMGPAGIHRWVTGAAGRSHHYASKGRMYRSRMTTSPPSVSTAGQLEATALILSASSRLGTGLSASWRAGAMSSCLRITRVSAPEPLPLRCASACFKSCSASQGMPSPSSSRASSSSSSSRAYTKEAWRLDRPPRLLPVPLTLLAAPPLPDPFPPPSMPSMPSSSASMSSGFASPDFRSPLPPLSLSSSL